MARIQLRGTFIASIIALGFIAGSGCKTKRVYLDDKPSWIQQATGEVDLGSWAGPETADWQVEEQEEQIDGEGEERGASRQQPKTASSERPESPPRIEVGPRKVTIRVEGEDY